MNKFKIILMGIAFLASACGKIDNIQEGCSIRVSEKVYKGEFEVEDVKYIKIIYGVTQQGLYPLPDWSKSKNMLIVEDPDFFEEFKSALIASGFKKDPPQDIHMSGNVQIQVCFKKGSSAYLFCRNQKHEFGVSPMFENDSYGVSNRPLFHIINRLRAPVPNN